MKIFYVLCLLFALALTAAGKEPVTVHLAGDSTMAEKRPEKRPETGWGEFLQQHFDEGKVRVDNHAQNGRSTRTFIAEGRWQAILDKLKVNYGRNWEG